MTTVLVVGDIRLYREGLALILRDAPGFESVGTAGDLPGAVGLYRRTRPDVVLLDAAMAGTVEAVRALVEAEPEMRVVVLGVDEEESEVIAYAEAGVSGYVTRAADTAALCDVLRNGAGPPGLTRLRPAGPGQRGLAVALGGQGDEGRRRRPGQEEGGTGEEEGRTGEEEMRPPIADLRNAGGLELRANSRTSALDVEAGVLIVAHQSARDRDRLWLGQVPLGDLRFECAL